MIPLQYVVDQVDVSLPYQADVVVFGSVFALRGMSSCSGVLIIPRFQESFSVRQPSLACWIPDACVYGVRRACIWNCSNVSALFRFADVLAQEHACACVGALFLNLRW
ncbi:unnamed protein product [Hapterophycus canaliculatus]